MPGTVTTQDDPITTHEDLLMATHEDLLIATHEDLLIATGRPATWTVYVFILMFLILPSE